MVSKAADIAEMVSAILDAVGDLWLRVSGKARKRFDAEERDHEKGQQLPGLSRRQKPRTKRSDPR